MVAMAQIRRANVFSALKCLYVCTLLVRLNHPTLYTIFFCYYSHLFFRIQYWTHTHDSHVAYPRADLTINWHQTRVQKEETIVRHPAYKLQTSNAKLLYVIYYPRSIAISQTFRYAFDRSLENMSDDRELNFLTASS